MPEMLFTEGGYGTNAGELLAMLERPAWHAKAACKGKPQDWWYPNQNQPIIYAAARAICARCPVAADCAEAGDCEEYGMWGGTSGTQRRDAKRRRSAA
jgi:hypothetical protein